MHRSPRPGGRSAIRKIVYHLNAGPEVEGGAAGLAKYLNTIDGGYHEIVDDKTFIVMASPDELVYGASGMNEHGYHICLIGQPQSSAQWHDAYSRGELTIAGLRGAYNCHLLGVTPRLLTDAQIADPNARGICDHWGVNRAITHGDHVDVGPNFPWVEFMGDMVKYYAPSHPASSAPSKITPDMPEWHTMIKVGERDAKGVYKGKRVLNGAPVYGYSVGGHTYGQGKIATLPGHSLFVRKVDAHNVAP